MPSKRTTINTITLTCSTCGSSQFTRLASNEYRCNHCQAVTLVEDDVAQRLEKILRGMQQPQTAAPQVKPTWIAGIIIAVAAISLIPVVASLLNSSSGPTPSSPRHETEKPIDAGLIKLTNVREVSTNSRRELVLLMHNDTGRKISAPTVSATFYRDDITLSSSSGSSSANTMMPGEYTPVRISLPSQPFTRYNLKVERVSSTSRTSRAVAAEKVQLVLNDGRYRLVGLLRNNDLTPASSSRVLVMLYGADGTLIGTGTGYGQASKLDPEAVTQFDAHCDMFGDDQVASYDYMVESEG